MFGHDYETKDDNPPRFYPQKLRDFYIPSLDPNYPKPNLDYMNVQKLDLVATNWKPENDS